ncbi:MAG: hypothetical protein K0R10_1542 [Alphaproteobacteria bacterium]|nr:hypothetical protein [Alphaproteobacteria bacterium]
MTASFKIRLQKEIIFAHHQGPDWAKESDGEYSYKFYHNVTLPFAPYPGLSVSYDRKDIEFDQGDKSAEKNKDVSSFNSGKIEAVTWDAGANAFTCNVAPARLKEDDDLGRIIWLTQRDHWFPAEDSQRLEMQEMITRWRMENAGEDAGNVCYSKDKS